MKPAETKLELVQRMMDGEDPEDMGWDLEQLGWDTRYLDGHEDGYPACFLLEDPESSRRDRSDALGLHGACAILTPDALVARPELSVTTR